MTKEQLAAMMHGREIGDETTPEIIAAAKENRLLIIYGASDDLCEFDGAFMEEAGCYNGGGICFTKNGKIPQMDEVTEALRMIQEQLGFAPEIPKTWLLKIEAVWAEQDPKGRECSWHYKADLPHATFDVMEDESLYCVGIVIDLKEI